MHVQAALPFGAKSLDIEFAQFLDEIVTTLNMFQLAVVTLHT